MTDYLNPREYTPEYSLFSAIGNTKGCNDNKCPWCGEKYPAYQREHRNCLDKPDDVE